MALIGITLVPRAASVRATRAVVSVRLAEAMQRNLLLHGRVHDRSVYDDDADVIGASVAAVVVAAAALMVWWLRVRALQPLFDLALEMQLFGEGRIDERASTEGPTELT